MDYSEFFEKKRKSISKLLGLPESDRMVAAFIHSSFLNEHPELNKKALFRQQMRLAFVGDCVLDLIVSGKLFLFFPFFAEGSLTQVRSQLVCNKSLAEFAQQIGKRELLENISVGRGFAAELEDDEQGHDRLLANVVEAIIGALYLSNDSLVECDKFLDRYDFWGSYFSKQIRMTNVYDTDALCEMDCKMIEDEPYEVGFNEPQEEEKEKRTQEEGNKEKQPGWLSVTGRSSTSRVEDAWSVATPNTFHYSVNGNHMLCRKEEMCLKRVEYQGSVENRKETGDRDEDKVARKVMEVPKMFKSPPGFEDRKIWHRPNTSSLFKLNAPPAPRSANLQQSLDLEMQEVCSFQSCVEEKQKVLSSPDQYSDEFARKSSPATHMSCELSTVYLSEDSIEEGRIGNNHRYFRYPAKYTKPSTKLLEQSQPTCMRERMSEMFPENNTQKKTQWNGVVKKNEMNSGDFKNKLQEFCQKNLGPRLPQYKTRRIGGVDHCPSFHTTLYYDNDILAEATAKTKKAAEAEAARIALWLFNQ